MSTITTRAGKGSPLTNTEVDDNFTNLNTDKLEDLVDDTSPQLGGDLDTNGNDITVADSSNLFIGSNNDVTINWNNNFSGLNIQNSVEQGFMQFNANQFYLRNTLTGVPDNNANYLFANSTATTLYQLGNERLKCDSTGVKISAAYHLPTADGTSGQVITTNGSGSLSFADAGGGASEINDLTDGFSNDSTSSLGLGENALSSAGSSADNTTAVGYNAGQNTTADNNTFIGANCGSLVTNGFSNTGVGSNALRDSTTGWHNIGIGVGALYQLTGNSRLNIGIGVSAGYNLTSGINNILIGDQATASSSSVNHEITIGAASQVRLRMPGIQASASNGDVLTHNASTGLLELTAPSGGGGGGLSQGKAIILAMVFG